MPDSEPFLENPEGVKFLKELVDETKSKSKNGKDPSKSTFFREIDKRVENPSYKAMDPLQKYNLILAIVHLILTIYLIVYFRRLRKENEESGRSSGLDFSLYDHVFELMINPTTAEQGIKVISERVVEIKDTDVGSLLVFFELITTGFHFFYALNPNNVYLDAVANGNNYFRWIEYAISASTLVLIVSLSSGIKSYKTAVLIVLAAIAIMSTGQLVERESNPRKRWLPIIIGFFLLAGVFFVIYRAFVKRLREAESAGIEVPSFVYWTLGLLLLFYSTFGAVPVVQQFSPKFDYRKVEYTYGFLSLTSKASISLLLALGIGARARSERRNN